MSNDYSRLMGVKYYTHFVLSKETPSGSCREFSGVVEVDKATECRFGSRQIETVLARNFDLRSGDLQLIHWARLH